MLRIWTLSGVELASLPPEEWKDIKEVKRYLHDTFSLPPRFRQRLLHQGEALIDTATVDAPMDLQLVLLPFVDASPVQVDAIIHAAQCGLADELEAMLQFPTDPDVADLYLQRPLARASRHGQVSCVRLLLEARANTELFATSMACVIAAANVGFDQVDMSRLLEARDTALHLAARQNHGDVARLLVAAGASLNLTDHLGFTPLQSAARDGCSDFVRVMLEARADIEAADAGGMTALALACLSGHVETARLLLGAGCKHVQARTPGHRPLILACASGQVEMVRLLLASDVDTETLDVSLLVASKHGFADIARLVNAALAKKYGSAGRRTLTGPPFLAPALARHSYPAAAQGISGHQVIQTSRHGVLQNRIGALDDIQNTESSESEEEDDDDGLMSWLAGFCSSSFCRLV